MTAVVIFCIFLKIMTASIVVDYITDFRLWLNWIIVVCVGIETDFGRRGNYQRGSSPDQYDSRYSQGRGGGSQGSRSVSRVYLWLCLSVIVSVVINCSTACQSVMKILISFDPEWHSFVHCAQKKNTLIFSFISPWLMCRFKQKLQWIYLRNGRFWQCRN